MYLPKYGHEKYSPLILLCHCQRTPTYQINQIHEHTAGTMYMLYNIIHLHQMCGDKIKSLCAIKKI